MFDWSPSEQNAQCALVVLIYMFLCAHNVIIQRWCRRKLQNVGFLNVFSHLPFLNHIHPDANFFSSNFPVNKRTPPIRSVFLAFYFINFISSIFRSVLINCNSIEREKTNPNKTRKTSSLIKSINSASLNQLDWFDLIALLFREWRNNRQEKKIADQKGIQSKEGSLNGLSITNLIKMENYR